ncbi:cysteine desulfurase [archaeon]|nr:cysteine desulfurase [archaeon]
MNVEKIREDFPLLKQKFNGKQVVYLDNAATSQKPIQVIETITDYYTNYNANVHRGLNFLSQKATNAYEEAHEKVAKFINANSMEEIVFTKNATESLNLLAYSLGNQLNEGDEVVVSVMEHHANLVPWQELEKRKKIKLKFTKITKEGTLDLENLKSLINNKTKIVSLSHASNILGTINPVEKISKIVRESEAYFILDSAQAAPHAKIDVKKIGVDFIAFSGHKMLGPTGIGALYGKKELLEEIPPFLTGGDMISSVSLEKSTWNKLPWKFEAGTPNIAGGIGFGAAIDYLEGIGLENIEVHEQKMLKYGLKRLKEIEGMTFYGPENSARTAIISFNLDKVHPHDVAQILDENAIAIRSGNHCAQPLMNELGIEGVARASFYIYNNEEEIDKLANALEQAKKVFGV